MITERLKDGWTWWRIAEAGWVDPLSPDYARERGGRWNAPASYPTLYLNEDRVTARLNLRLFIEGWPYEPEDLRDETGPMLVGATLPRNQEVCDVHTPEGVRAVGLPLSYPNTKAGRIVPHAKCQPVGQKVKDAGLRGIRARSVQSPDGAGRELAWFPATAASVAKRIRTLKFDAWYWS